MLYLWNQIYPNLFKIQNILKYITFRTLCAILTSLFVSFLIGNKIILWLRNQQGEGQPIRLDGPESHLLSKKGTPTMGGCLILLSLTLSTLLWADLSNPFIWICLLITLGFGALGAYDDYLKLTKRSHKGLSGKFKLLGQILLSLTGVLLIHLCAPNPYSTCLMLPFLKGVSFDLGLFFFVWAVIVIVGASNAVNLTDGLDGLAIVPIMMAAVCFALISYLVGNKIFATYLQVPYIPQTGELAVFLGSLLGAGLGFLWFNAPPAKVFMGDTGSLSTGAALGLISVITKHEIVLSLVGGLFVWEALSVIIQVSYFKMTRRRVFLMAPIHHHFEKKGWSEPTVVIRFWIIAAVLSLLGLSTLKIR